MPPSTFQRYNAKARGSVAGGSSHKKGKRKASRDGNETVEEVLSQPHYEPGMSSKKRKRLDSYIAKKLQHERREETLKTIAALQPTNGTSLALYSTASLGQNPLKPTTALERAERTEDRAVRHGIEHLRRRHGDSNHSDGDRSSSDDSTPIRKGKEKALDIISTHNEKEGVETTILETKAERKARERTEARGGAGGKLRMPKKANWNPNLLGTQPDSSSSDFDSSDSEQDSVTETIEKSTETEPTVLPEVGLSLPRHSPVSSPLLARPATLLGTALKKPKEDDNLKSVKVGGALKTSSNGVAVPPRIVLRGKKKFAPARVQHHLDGESSEENSENDKSSAEDSSEYDEESGEDSYDSDDSDAEDDSDDSHNRDMENREPSSSTEDHVDEAPKIRAMGFKDWARKQMGQTPHNTQPDLLATTTTGQDGANQSKKPSRPAPKTGEFVGPLGAALSVPSTSLITGSSKSALRPTIQRRSSVGETRMDLPILAEEQNIVEAVLMHPVVIICGETGSGKTTQVPQMLYEAGFGFPGSDNPGMIAVTQPRRVAAVSLATRVRDELGFSPRSSIVAHQIRYSSTTAPDTSIKFMTDGVLLRELASDFMLSRYSVVVVDEAHERGVNTDVLIGVLSRVARLREKRWREVADKEDKLSPLRIVIMSATLRVSDFAENVTLFPTAPPVIHISARQHPVTVHFSRRTSSDYVTEAYKKVCKIHSRLPPGAVLVFLTGQSEIMGLCRQLEKKYGKSTPKGSKKDLRIVDGGELPPEIIEAEDVDLGGDHDLAADVDDGVAESDSEALDTDEDSPDVDTINEPSDVHILPLYSLLPHEQQMAVFQPPPEGSRLVIVATNVAETSLTIPGVRYVVDCGRSKERQYDAASGVQTFAVSWISKASAAQRAGRAGRTGPGHCYRLYSSALFEDHFAAFSEPEILRMPIEGVVLQMKSMNIDAVINFPFPTPPDRQSLSRAEALLQHLGALNRPISTRMVAGVQRDGSTGGQITSLGRAMASYPVSPRFAKMLVVGAQHNCLAYVVAIVAGLSVNDPFIHENSLELGEDDDDMGEDEGRAAELAHVRNAEVREKEERKDLRRRYFKAHSQFMSLGKGESDMFKLLAAIGAYEFDPTPSFCSRNFLRPKAMQEIQQLRSQISAIAGMNNGRLMPPDSRQLKILRQILTAGFIDQVAVLESVALKKGAAANLSTRGVAYRALGVPEPVFFHPSSALFHLSPPEFIVFTELVRTSRVWVKGITKIHPAWLAELGKDMCTFSRPVDMPAATKIKLVSCGSGDNEREVIVVPHFRDLGVDLPPVKRKQRREGTRWVTLDEA